MQLVWLSLLILFLAFFYSFQLNAGFIIEKLPFLISDGMVTTLYISAMAIAIAFVLAIVGALAKLSGNGIAMGVAAFYTSYFRGIPLLMQLFLIYVGLPQIGFVIDPIPAGVIALSTCYGAYMTEIFRAGIESIPRGQWEAAEALGLSRAMTLRKVIMPQAMRVIIPPTSNQFIAMLKDSSLVSVVGVWDLMFVARAQGRADFRVLEMLITASLIYWALSIVLELAQTRIERHFAASDRSR
ncbi:amino acid ABC transporter permease [Noviherbaspirillum saxi]|uniref:Glutamate/aspartate import permease protein GltK n=2 Tax=Noviherbaspirillum saxi TaxID=2320863 RepID=A0A3A3FV93_9BURK|nr:amino acid ABC transporter permease [Noviherbaspirillum saxi]